MSRLTRTKNLEDVGLDLVNVEEDQDQDPGLETEEGGPGNQSPRHVWYSLWICPLARS